MIKPTFLRRVAIAALLSGSCFSAAAAPPAPPVSYGVEEDVFHPVRAKQGMVASVDATATQVGVDILKEGGNAVDAAVAVGYALAVTHPQAGNLGGGGFMLIRSKNGNTTAIDFREMAPAKATRDMFLDDQGNPDSKKSLTSHLASGTPGTVAGFSLALDKYGTMPLNKVVQPAFKLARDGFIVNDALADDLKTYGSEVLPNHENSKAIFWKEGEPLKKGDTLVQANLAKSLEMIAENGPDEFYKGTIAEQPGERNPDYGCCLTSRRWCWAAFAAGRDFAPPAVTATPAENYCLSGFLNAAVATEFAFSVADSASLFAGFAESASGFASAAGWVSDTPAG